MPSPIAFYFDFAEGRDIAERKATVTGPEMDRTAPR